MTTKRLIGIPNDFVLGQPFVGSALPRMPGLPLGHNTRIGNDFEFDPWWMHRLGIVDAPVYLSTGRRGFGKSTLHKVIALRNGQRKGQYSEEEGRFRPVKIQFNDRKIEDKDPEYAPLTRCLEGEIIPLSKRASINILDIEMMDEADMIDAVVNICEMVSDVSPLPRFQETAIQIGVWKMLKERRNEASLEVLEAKLLGITIRDAVEYFQASNSHVSEVNIPEHSLIEDAALVATSIDKVLRGSFGGIFGGTNSIRDILSYPVVLLDWTGVNEKARTLLAAMLWKWRGIALRRGDKALIADMVFTDEEHQAMRNLMYARYMSASLKEIRAFTTAYFMSTQVEMDLTMAGDPGTEIRKLAISVGQSIGGRFITQQVQDSEILEFYRNLGMSDPDVRTLPQLKRGHYFFLAQKYPAVPFRLDLTELEKILTDTESANRAMTTDIETAMTSQAHAELLRQHRLV